MKYRINYLFCTWFLSGKFPIAPGTAGTLAAIPLWFLLNILGHPGYYFIVLLLFFLGIVSAGYLAGELQEPDPSIIVIDEVVGFLIAACGVANIKQLILAFCIFRLLDIFKPWPINFFEQKFSGGLGIMLDDVLAGIITYLILLSFSSS